MASPGLWASAARGMVAVSVGSKGSPACLSAVVCAAPSPSLGQSPRRGIAGRVLRQELEQVKKPKPFPYEEKQFTFANYFFGFDRCTLRFDENTKLVVVEGAHAVGKSKFAQELAEDLGMKYMPRITMDDKYKSPYGKVDLRDYNEYFLPRVRPYDDKDFIRDPTEVPGCRDRMLHQLYHLKWKQYIFALRHIFNTGQGVVLDSSCYSTYCDMEASYNAGWVDRESRRYMHDCYKASLHHLMRPNLIIYLDAPVETVQKKIASRGNEWDKDSPVWSNTQYLNDLYNMMKKDYLRQAQPHSHVLVYDWSEPGDTEIVVEDIEKLNFDYFGNYEEPQKDWRLYNEMYATIARLKYSRSRDLMKMEKNLVRCSLNTEAEQMYYTPEEILNLQHILGILPHHRFKYGYNADAGDKGIWYKFEDYKHQMYDLPCYHFDAYRSKRMWDNIPYPEKKAEAPQAQQQPAASS